MKTMSAPKQASTTAAPEMTDPAIAILPLVAFPSMHLRCPARPSRKPGHAQGEGDKEGRWKEAEQNANDSQDERNRAQVVPRPLHYDLCRLCRCRYGGRSLAGGRRLLCPLSAIPVPFPTLILGVGYRPPVCLTRRSQVPPQSVCW